MNRYLTVVALLIAALALGACSALAKGSSESAVSSNTQVLRFRWKKKLYSNIPNFNIPEFYEEHDRFSPVETAGAAFDTDARRILVGGAVGGFYCLDAASGNTVWRYDLDDPVGSTPYYDAGRKRVYVGVDDGYLYAFHSRSGRKLWATDTGAELRRAIWMRDDTLFAVNADNTVLAVDPQGGEIVWRYHRPPVDGFSSVGYGDLTFSGDTLVVGFSDGTLVALDKGTGEQRWEVDLAEEAIAAADVDEVVLVDIDATPVVANGMVVAASIAGGMAGVDLATGDTMWTRTDLDMVTGMATMNNEIYAVRSGSRGLVSLHPETGSTILESSFGAGLKSDPLVYDDLLIVSDTEAGLYTVSAGTGHVLDLLDVDGGFFARPVEYAGYLLIMGNWTTLFSFAIN